MLSPESNSSSQTFALPHARRQCGFTLLELLVTACIAALLMVGVLTLVAHLSLDQSRLSRRQSSAGSGRIVELLRQDLVRSVEIDAGDSASVSMQGYAAIDPATLMPTGRSARIVYRVIQTEAGPWLVRQQQALDAPGETAWIQSVAQGVRSLKLTPIVAATTALSVATSPPDQSIQNQSALVPPWGASAAEQAAHAAPDGMPDQVRLSLQWSDPQRPPLVEQMILR